MSSNAGIKFNLPHKRFRDNQGRPINGQNQCRECVKGGTPFGVVLAQPGYRGTFDEQKITFQKPIKNAFLPSQNIKE